ncbi:hypothetical protein FQ087_08400 [Sporosarcina sp. ANT_H38]|uniref:hypothetical protein n=1 Tax=Sporosarcina sp. ANT_H38 TaxID=2597358 RepID=UPI0011F2BB5A|nr:hypothetical protein [Sporosarcina sp. ANT_H38]KAA0966245.1 hypothetical protein FQ087_08400 [Sporosarcina sp. ANT_H38]
MLEDLLTALIPNGTNSLDTQKIDKNIEMLMQHSWFKNIYDDERYRRLFFGNRKVRKYLQNTYRVKRIIKKEKVRQKFILLLNEQ